MMAPADIPIPVRGGNVWATWLVALLLVAAATWVLLVSASPEFCWDEADYAASVNCTWHTLWAKANYCRHGHGPMLVYLAKLGQELLPTGCGSLETRWRFFDALVASSAVGLIFVSLRYLFQTSMAAALVGASLFLFSGTRAEESNVIGPHGLMVVCTIALVALGYHWRNKPSLVAALGLGAVFAYGALTMSYVIPAAVGWVFALAVAGKGWFGLNRQGVRISWYVALTGAVAGLLFIMLWPGGANPRTYPKDFLAFVFFPNHCGLVGNSFYEVVPKWASFFWMANLDPVLAVTALGVFALVVWRVLHGLALNSRHGYLAASVFFFAFTSLTAHLAGARSILQLLAVLSLATGALFDEAVGAKPWRGVLSSAVIIIAAGLGLFWVVKFSSYTPFLATDGYKACLQENQARMSEKVGAIVYGVPVLHFYSGQSQVPVAWDAAEMPCITTRGEIPLPPEIKYVLIPSYVDEGMPLDHTMRRVVATTWKRVWSYKSDRVWELRLYERP